MSKQSDLVNITQGDTLYVDHTSGNVGIGTSSLSNGLRTVIQGPQTGGAPATSGTTQTYGLLRLQGTTFTSALDMGTNGGNYAWIQSTDQANLATNYSLALNPNGGNVGIGTSSTANGKLVVENNGSNLYLKQTTGDYGHIIGQNDSDGALTFSRRDGGNTERMRIQSNGTVLINTTSFFQGTKVGIEAPDIDIFSVRGNNVGAGYRYDSTSSTGLAAYFSHSSNTVAAGSITIGSGSTSYNTSSDYRLKENVVDLINASDRLKQLAPKRFNFIYADGEDQNPTVDGFLAHEVQAIVPEAVTGSKDAMRTQDVYDEDGNITGTEQVPDYQGIDQSKLVPLLTAALQEALNKITDLETRITALETV